ncbi:MAG TPA: amino acid adenylation domain-containing protein, partial [Thermoanaerobaculia bacterium]|nr:amino acid adenylation domain-containing protein [Thermoanaerobaculia bacterium]
AYPPERLALMLAEGRVPVLLATPELERGLPASARVVLLATDGRLPPGQELPEPRPARGDAAGPESLAYVMFTSGSTGRPKAVAAVHRGVVRLVRGADYARFGPEEVFLQLAPASFDASTLEIWGALLHGGRLVLMPPEMPTLSGLGEALARYGVTTLWLTAGLFHQMVEENLSGLAPVRQLLAGGDTLSPAQVARAARELPGTRLINGYGPTEGTTFTCCWPVDAARLDGSVLIGRPIANTRVFVLDREDQLAAVGVPGELAVGGDGLARGYLGRPDLTAERFRPDPFGGPGGRLYRTGDRGRWQASGEIELLGRIDQQVKIRGFRVEPGEVEAILAGHPELRQAAVLVREERPGDKRLVAYAAARPGAAVASADLRRYLKERLPEYMVPGTFVLLGAFPLTPNGKVDRRALAAVGPEGSRKPGLYLAPRTPAEALLARIWAEVLEVERVGIEDNFFDLGGHSLLATRVLSRVARELWVELPVRALFESPTVAGLAARIAAALPAAASGPRPVARGEGAPLHPCRMPLSFAQERLWFLDRLEPGSAVYGIPAALRLTGALSQPALAAAFTTVVSRHEALRTTFAEAEGGAVQWIASPGPVALPVADLSGLPAVAREGAASSLASAAARRPFDLPRGPLLRLSLLRLGADDHLLVLTVHHIVADGWSLGILVREVGEIYGALVAGREPDLPALPMQYADYAVWQRRWLAGEALSEQLAWWREKLAGVPTVLGLPADRPRPPVQSRSGGSLAVRLPAGLLAGLAVVGREGEASPFMVLLAGFAALLSRHAGQAELIVGAPVANRTHREIEGLVGFFVNTLALPIRLGEDPPFAALLAQVRETTLGAYTHQDLPFERLVEELAPERNLAYSPLFQVMLALENTGLRAPSLPGFEVAVIELPSGTEKFDLSLQLSEISGGLAGVLSYSRALFDRTTVERLWAHFLTLLDRVAGEPERRVSELPLLGAPERQQLREWGWAPPLPIPPPEAGATLARLFAEQAARTPGAEALIWGEQRLTYGELAARAGRLARRLAALGVGPEERVAVCLPRSAGLVVALLGVLEAGGAYVPLDPAYPAERQRLMLADSRAAVVLTSAGLAGPAGPAGLSPGLPPGARAVVALDPATGEPEAPGAESVTRAAGPGNLAYLIYTSGSTGRPKAVAIEHRSAAGRVRWARQAFTGEELSGVLFATSVCFDLSVFELFVPLSSGGRVILAENALALPGLPAAGDVRLVNTVPSAMAELVREGLLPRGVRTVNLAGELLPRPLAAAIHGTGRVGRLWNLYGPSEDTTYSTGSAVAPGEPGAPAIGHPLPG